MQATAPTFPISSAPEMDSIPMATPVPFTVPPTVPVSINQGTTAPQLSTHSMPASEPPSEWKTGLCDCCSGPDCFSVWCCTACCPCVAYGEVASHINPVNAPFTGDFCVPCTLFFCLNPWWQFGVCFCPFIPTHMFITHGLRIGFRKQFNIEGSEGCDCCVSCCCLPCATCQMLRELKLRGSKAYSKASPSHTSSIVPPQQSNQLS
mmetsp:Transcript_44544/g.69684  ORF Transcript_44544/g.69684 Transcript_44544/m.69684 type:complete len:206 (-) Transcript_44544:476-1093(-)